MKMKRGPLTNHFCSMLVYLGLLLSTNTAQIREILEPLYLWNDVWLLVFGFGLVIFVGILYDWLLLNGHDTAWQKMNGFMDKEILDTRRKLLLYEHCETSVTKGFANGALVAMMAAVVVAFVWFTFLA